MKNNSLTVSFILRRIGQTGAEVVGTGANVREAKRNAQSAFRMAGLPRTRAALVAIILANGEEVDRCYGYSLRTCLARYLTTKDIRNRLNKA